jgi:hypothetical protein
MPEPLMSEGTAEKRTRPFPWYCPKCRRQEVTRVTIPYQCQRVHNGQSITVTLPNLSVPRCGHCGELVFDYDAEEQINRHVSIAADNEAKKDHPCVAPDKRATP